jgi:hypothetical protein
MDEVKEPQIEDALVLVDFIEDESETGEDRPEEVTEAINGLSGLIDDSEIQSRSDSLYWHPSQSLFDVSLASGDRLVRDWYAAGSAAGSLVVVRVTFMLSRATNKPLSWNDSLLGLFSHN